MSVIEIFLAELSERLKQYANIDLQSACKSTNIFTIKIKASSLQQYLLYFFCVAIV